MIMADQENIMEHLVDVFHKQETGLNGQAGTQLHDFQKRSFEALKRIQFPDRKHEDWKYTPVQKLISPKYKLATHQPAVQVSPVPGLDSYIILVVNGRVDLKDVNARLPE